MWEIRIRCSGCSKVTALENSATESRPIRTAPPMRSALVFPGLLTMIPSPESRCVPPFPVLREMRTMLHRYYPDVPTVSS